MGASVVHKHLCTHKCTCMDRYIHTFMHTHTHARARTHAHTHTHTRARAHTVTHTHTSAQESGSRGGSREPTRGVQPIEFLLVEFQLEVDKHLLHDMGHTVDYKAAQRYLEVARPSPCACACLPRLGRAPH